MIGHALIAVSLGGQDVLPRGGGAVQAPGGAEHDELCRAGQPVDLHGVRASEGGADAGKADPEGAALIFKQIDRLSPVAAAHLSPDPERKSSAAGVEDHVGEGQNADVAEMILRPVKTLRPH